jgi:uncharacterized protein (TIGR03067 family)
MMFTALAPLAAMLLSCTVLGTLGFVPVQDAKPNHGPAELQGTWKFTAVEINGEMTTLDVNPRIKIQGNALFYAKKALAQLMAEPSASPHTLDLKFLAPEQVLEGIYACEGTQLKICLNTQTEGVKERPNTLATKGQATWRMLIFEKEQNPPKDELEGIPGFVGVALRMDEETKQILASFTLEGSPAQQAGLQKDDVLVTIGGEAAATLQGAVALVRKAKPESKLAFHIRRSGKEMDITVAVAPVPLTVLAQIQ